MKKLWILGLGMLLLGTSIIALPEASREAYQQFLYRKMAEQKRFRRYAQPTIPTAEYATRDAVESQRRRRQNLLFPTYAKRDFYAQTNESIVVEKPFRPHSMPRGTYRSPSKFRGIIIGRHAKLREVFSTYVDPAFTVELPQGWNPSNSDGYVSLVDPGSNITIKIKRFLQDDCDNMNFSLCAISLGKNENRLRSKTDFISNPRIVRRKGGSDTNMHSNNLRTRYYEESMVAQGRHETMFIARKFVQGLDGEVFMIEVEGSEDQANYTVPLAKRIFDTFRFFSYERRFAN